MSGDEEQVKDERNSDGSIPKDSAWGRLIEELIERRKKFEEEHGELELIGKVPAPCEVSKVLLAGFREDKSSENVGSLVRVRLVEDEAKETYLGILLGDFVRDALVSRASKSKVLFLTAHRNPAIFVPKLRRIVWGCSSWWALVESEEDIERIITDADIAGTWYVKLLRELGEKKRTKEQGAEKEVIEGTGTTQSDVEFIARKRAELKAKGLTKESEGE